MGKLFKHIDISIILENKQELMGIAIISIFLFHSQFAHHVPFLGHIIGFGSHGVDIFFFLSAIGLSASLNRNDNIWAFYKRRIIRILPTLFLFLIVVHILGMRMGWAHPHTWIQKLCWYSTMGWWTNGLFDDPFCYYYEGNYIELDPKLVFFENKDIYK